MPYLAVVIVSWNVRELLASCLSSLLDDVRRSGREAHVWVVDNASTDGTPDIVTRDFPSVHLIAEDENVGFAAGNNLALQEILHSPDLPRSDGFIWLLNPDTEVQPGATDELTAALARRKRIGVTGAKLLYPDGSLQHSAFRFPGLVQLAFELFALPQRLYDTPLNGRYPRRVYDSGRPFSIDHPLGASMMIRRETIEDVGLLDESYQMYCEEIDWCWRMQEAGWGALCVPMAEITHHAGQSTSQIPVRSFVNLWTSRARLYARHHGVLTWRLAKALVRTGMRRCMGRACPEMVTACQDIMQAWEGAR